MADCDHSLLEGLEGSWASINAEGRCIDRYRGRESRLWPIVGLLTVPTNLYVYPRSTNVKSMGVKVWREEDFIPTNCKAFPHWRANTVTGGCWKSGEPVLELRVRFLCIVYMLKIHHQVSFARHYFKRLLPSSCFHVDILCIMAALGINWW